MDRPMAKVVQKLRAFGEALLPPRTKVRTNYLCLLLAGLFLIKDMMRSWVDIPASGLWWRCGLVLGFWIWVLIAARRRLVYLGWSPWWAIPITSLSFGSTIVMLVTVEFGQLGAWLVYFLPQLPLLISDGAGRSETEVPQNQNVR
jgi:hypothetical protein